MIVLYAYLVIINVVTFLMYGIDKARAIQDHYRIPERVLLGLAAIGGSPGAIVGMLLFHHKIRKPKFAFGVPMMLIAHIALIIFISIQIR